MSEAKEPNEVIVSDVKFWVDSKGRVREQTTFEKRAYQQICPVCKIPKGYEEYDWMK